MVNSSHHQAVAVLGDGLIKAAWSLDDGVVEAAEGHGDQFLMGVQWHPELSLIHILRTSWFIRLRICSMRAGMEPWKRSCLLYTSDVYKRQGTTWMIGNSPKSDINPALACGLHAVFIHHPHTWVCLLYTSRCV